MKIKLKLIAGILAIIATLGMLAAPAGATISSAGPFYSGGTGSARQCAFYGWDLTVTGDDVAIEAKLKTRKGSSCTTLLPLPGQWMQIVIQPQYLAPNLQWVNSSTLDGIICNNPISASDLRCPVPYYNLQSNLTHRFVIGYEVLLQGAARQHLSITPIINIPTYL